ARRFPNPTNAFWWIVYTQPTTRRNTSASFPESHQRRDCAKMNPTNAVGGSFILSLRRTDESLRPVIPPTQLVDRSYSAYDEPRLEPCFPNPTNAVGGSFILSLRSACHEHVVSQIPPTQLVDRSHLAYKAPDTSTSFPKSHHRG